MQTAKKKTNTSKERILRPTLSPEAQEDRCISLAYSLVEQRLLDGTATAQETTHFLRLGTMRAKYEKELLEEKIKLARAQTEQLESATKVEELISEALSAFREYSGDDEDFEDEDY